MQVQFVNKIVWGSKERWLNLSNGSKQSPKFKGRVLEGVNTGQIRCVRSRISLFLFHRVAGNFLNNPSLLVCGFLLGKMLYLSQKAMATLGTALFQKYQFRLPVWNVGRATLNCLGKSAGIVVFAFCIIGYRPKVGETWSCVERLVAVGREKTSKFMYLSLTFGG